MFRSRLDSHARSGSSCRSRGSRFAVLLVHVRRNSPRVACGLKGPLTCEKARRPHATNFRFTALALVCAAATLFPVDGAQARVNKRRSRQIVHRSGSMRRVRSPYPGSGTAPSMEAAIAASFPAVLHRQALNVAWCESRGRASARNGQYRGHFQIGKTEWSRYGSGNPFNPYDNSRAAYRYYQAVGSWRPWECQP